MGILFLDDLLIVPNIKISIRAGGNEYIFEKRDAVKDNLGFILLEIALVGRKILIADLNKIGRIFNIVVLKSKNAVELPLRHVVVAA